MENLGFDLEIHGSACGDCDEEGVAQPRSVGEVVDGNEGQDEVVFWSWRRNYWSKLCTVRRKRICCTVITRLPWISMSVGGSNTSSVCYKKPETRTGCRAMVSFVCDDSGQWKVSRFLKEHNHEMAPAYAKPSVKSGQGILAANVYGSGGALESLVSIGPLTRAFILSNVFSVK
ncbi:hypothetical protein SASPL_145599 [Salvia splendens]|uniref:FAR1 domain-containing protein n=1 Tax=Salvia splendens TaxID=180675 RepID=A0A8X8Z883_SALSN|nr:hypothetical protein SASPL_145599 [Salvia splendens]